MPLWFFDADDAGVYLKDTPNDDPDEEASSRSRKISAKKIPPKSNQCSECTEFTGRGSTVYTIKKTCLVCGHSETTRRDQTPKFSPENCTHADVDFRGSSRTTHRTFCKLCCTFIDEAPRDIRKERVTFAKKVENAPMNKVAIVDSLVEDDVDHLTPDQIDNILAHFASLVATCSESQAMTRPRLHELLHQAITDTDEDSFQMVGDLVDDSHAYTGSCFHTDDPVGHPDGMVEAPGEVRDMYSRRDVYCILDEGCNSTCHSCNTQAQCYGV